MRSDGKCVVCGKSRKTKRSKRYGKDAAERDPFCSTQCCRAYHGNPLSARSIWEQDYGVGRVSA